MFKNNNAWDELHNVWRGYIIAKNKYKYDAEF
jgi:hypothetical protein